MVNLAANNGEELNFIIKDSAFSTSNYNECEVTDSDKEVRMKPRSFL